MKLTAFFLFAMLMGAPKLFASRVNITGEGQIGVVTESTRSFDLKIIISNLDVDETADSVFSGLELYLPNSGTEEKDPILKSQDLDDELNKEGDGRNEDYMWDAGNDIDLDIDADSSEGKRQAILNIRITQLNSAEETIADLLEKGEGKIIIRANFYIKDEEGNRERNLEDDDVIVLEQNFNLPNEAVEGISVAGAHKSLIVRWNGVEKVAYTNNGGSFAPGKVNVILFDADSGSITLSGNVAKFSKLDGTDPTETNCEIFTAQPGDTCIQCDKPDNTYLVASELKNTAGIVDVKSVASEAGVTTFLNLESGKTYGVALEYANGVKRSLCFEGTSQEDTTLGELNGEPDASVSDSPCFIVSATYGSPLEPQVDLFRWFRDQALLTTSGGRAFVDWYYVNSPPVADFIKQRPALQALSLAVLAPMAAVISAAKWLDSPWFVILAPMLLLLVLLWGAHQVFRKPSLAR